MYVFVYVNVHVYAGECVGMCVCGCISVRIYACVWTLGVRWILYSGCACERVYMPGRLVLGASKQIQTHTHTCTGAVGV